MNELKFIYLMCSVFVPCIMYLLVVVYVTKPRSKYRTLVACVALLFTTVFIPSKGFEDEFKFTHEKVTEKVIVSSKGSSKISGSFSLGSGVVDQKRFYLLREEVKKDLYKDFEVKQKVYIREDNSLTNKGKFLQYFTCGNRTLSYSFMYWTLSSHTKNVCRYKKQEIVVPEGFVVKDLNI